MPGFLKIDPELFFGYPTHRSRHTNTQTNTQTARNIISTTKLALIIRTRDEFA